MIDFDADAYMAAAAGPAAARDFFLQRMVLGEGSRVRCADPRQPDKLVRCSRGVVHACEGLQQAWFSPYSLLCASTTEPLP